MLTFLEQNYLWLLLGGALVVLLVLAVRLGRGERTWQGRLLAPLNWYNRNPGARRLTVNILGAALILWGVHAFTAWVTPALRPSQLFTPPVVGPQAVRIAPVKEGPLDEFTTYTGTVKPWEDDIIYARVSGWVRRLTVYPGDPVHVGEVLATLDLSALRPRLYRAEAQVTYWRAEFARDRKLYEAGAISAAHFDSARMRYHAAQASLQQIKTEIGYATLYSPLNGVVAKRHVYPGVYVHTGEMMVKVDDLNRVRIQFPVDESDLQWVHVGTVVYLRFPQLSDTALREHFPKRFVREPDGRMALETHVAAVFPQENPMTRTAVVEVRIHNPGMFLLENTYVVGDLVRRSITKGILIPADALTTEPGGKQVVFTVPPFSEQGTVEERTVTVGVRGLNRVQILKGLKVGDFVVVEGNRALVNGQIVDVLNLNQVTGQ